MSSSNLSLGLSKKIKKSDVISKVLKQGKRKSSHPIRIHYLWESTRYRYVASGFEVGFIAPKRIYRKAVQRNHVKRLMRESLRHNQGLIPKREGQYLQLLVVATRQDIETYEDVNQAIVNLLTNIVILSE